MGVPSAQTSYFTRRNEGCFEKIENHKDVNSIARCIDPDASVNQVWPCLLLLHPSRRDHAPSPSRSTPSASDNDSEDDDFMVGK